MLWLDSIMADVAQVTPSLRRAGFVREFPYRLTPLLLLQEAGLSIGSDVSSMGGNGGEYVTAAASASASVSVQAQSFEQV